MSEARNLVREHYAGNGASGALAGRVQRLLDHHFGEGSGAEGARPLTVAELAPMDQFHTRGLAATEDLAALANIHAHEAVLDAGSGFGGPARLLAATCGCHVTGVDLTPAFVEVAHLLTVRASLTHLCRFETGDITALSFADASFEVVWTQHVVMNIAERDKLYTELRRVLKPGGRLAFYDILAADEGSSALEFPVPWSHAPESSHLLTTAGTRAALEGAGFQIVEWKDLTDTSIAWVDEMGRRGPAPAGSLSLASVLDSDFPAALRNLGRNFHAGRLRVVMGLARAV